MANCKFCGTPVERVSVHHAACWEKEADKMAGVFCDSYCRWPRECADEYELEEKHCADCALIKLLNLGL